jgi:hypothetical protein
MNPYYKIRRIIRDFWYDLRSRCWRFKRGWSYSDVWNMDYWFIETIKPMLIHLRDHGCGCPTEFYDEETDSCVAWTNILTEMVNCLDMMNEDNVYKHYGFDDWGCWERMTTEDYKNIYNTMEKNKNRFFELFSKHFYSLWD